MTESNIIKVSNKIIAMVVLILIAAVSMLYVSEVVTGPEFNRSTIESLEEKEGTVMKLTVAAAASSTALTLIPGDTAMPVANQIAELSNYFIVILAAILLEKMLIAVVGYVSFTYIIPFACLMGILYVYTKKELLLSIAIKMAIFGIVLFFAIPASIHISNLIDESYQDSLNQTLEDVEKNKEYIEEKNKDYNEEKNNGASTEDKSWINKVGDEIEDKFFQVTSGIEHKISGLVSKGEDTLAAFLNAVAVLIVTSCVIPIIIILIFVGSINILFGFEIKGNRLFQKN